MPHSISSVLGLHAGLREVEDQEHGISAKGTRIASAKPSHSSMAKTYVLQIDFALPHLSVVMSVDFSYRSLRKAASPRQLT